MALDGKWKYHVFLSFRGEDTRLSFTDHLYAALNRKSIITFRDDEELNRGEVISQELLNAIQESFCAVVILSQNYASSTWCLDELLKIIESKRAFGQQVFPVFYGVDPSSVRHQRGSFAEAFRKHEERFAENKEKVQKWREALKEVANISGWDSKDQHETKLIEEIVAQVWTKLEPKLATYNDGLVAMNSKLEDVYSHLSLGLEDVRYIGIWGMGGIGKTTLADVVFKKIRSQFDVSCFLADVREASKEGDQGMVYLQNKLLSHLKLKSMVIESSAQGKDSIRSLLCNQKVLLVLDDVSAKSQLQNLAGNQEWFGLGSRIIVTTRDKHLLISHTVFFQLYEIKILNTDESLHLFCEKAFKGDQPKEDHLELAKNVVEYAGGLPLALYVLGSLLCERSVQEWEDTLYKIRKVPDYDILNKLKISYDMLEDEHKTIFLDIACFFKGWYKDKVTQILDSCGLHPTIGINILIEKSLVTCDGGVLGMHDSLQEMGKTIVFQEYPHNRCRRSRLWSLEEIDEVFNKNIGTEDVQGIVWKTSTESYAARWHPKGFSRMCNLRLLIILCDLHLPLGLKCLPSSLKVLIWRGYPLKAVPLDVHLDELVHLKLCNSKVKKLWNGTQFFGKLKVIDLTESRDLIKSPNVSGVPNLEELYLNSCTSLVEVHRSVGQHKKLSILSLVRCENLKILPSKLEMSSLKRLILSFCLKVKRLPDFGDNMECVSELDLTCCENLLCLPNSISNLRSLKILNISGCTKVCTLPDNINENKALEDFDLSGTSVREVNSSLFRLENLKRLSFSGCSGPVIKSQGLALPFGLKYRMDHASSTTLEPLILPHFVSGLSSLTSLDLSDCNLSYGLIPEDLGHLSSLERLILSGNKNLELPADHSIANLSKLRCLELEGCKLRSRPVLPPHARIYPDDFGVEACSLDPRKLWKLFEPCDSESSEPRESERTDSLLRFLSKMPPRFHNQNFFPVDQHFSKVHSSPSAIVDTPNGCPVEPHFSKVHSSASAIVDIPNGCRRGEWWGIAVFVALDLPMSSALSSNSMGFHWSFEPPHPEAGPSLYLCSLGRIKYGNCYLLTMIMNDSFIFIQQHLRQYHRRSKRKYFRMHWMPEFSENSTLRVEVKVKGRKIREFAWHVLGKEDFQISDNKFRGLQGPAGMNFEGEDIALQL